MKDEELKHTLQFGADGFAAALKVHAPKERVRLIIVATLGHDLGKGFCVGAQGLTDADALVMLSEAMAEIIARDPNAAEQLARLQAEPEHIAKTIEELKKKEPTK
jgi:hypothetical protein